MLDEIKKNCPQNNNNNNIFLPKMAPLMCFHPQVFWWPFSSPCEGKNKHQEEKNKNAC